MLGHLLPLFSLIPYVLAQNDSYAPTNVSCPQDTSQLLRLTGSTASSNQSLSSGESDYVSARKSKIESSFQELLSNHSIGYSADDFDSSNWPTLGLAVSGGGFRAALYGAGVFTALDGRNQTSAEAGLGGFLQVATYASGLSGGSWFLGSWAIHDAPSPAQLALGSPDNDDLGWILENDLFVPDGVFGFFGDNQDYYDAIQDDVGDKREAGFNVSITDVWSRALSYHFAPGTTQDNFYDQDAAHGAGILWSDIRDTSSFQNHDMPFPMIVATLHTDDPVDPGAFNTIPLNHTVFEFNPFELGSYDPMLGAFVEVGYTGTSLISGTPVETGGDNCVNNYDQFAFAIGTSSSLFNAILHTASGIAQDSGFADVVLQILGNLGIDTDEDDSSYFALYPNAFQQVSSDSFGSSDTSELMLCDGGLNGENVPLNPLLASARGVDVIFAIDSSADTDDNWPNGTALITTQARQQVDELAGAYQVPPLPDSPEGFTSNGYNTRPTFFGCNESADAAALLVYMPNVPSEDGEYQTNTNTFKLQYDVDEATAFIENVQTNAFRGNADPGNRDEDFPSCLACAVMERARQRAGLERSSQCSSCFDTYCASNLEATESATEEEDSGASAQTLSVSAVIAAVALLVMV